MDYSVHLYKIIVNYYCFTLQGILHAATNEEKGKFFIFFNKKIIFLGGIFLIFFFLIGKD